jgi:hypothetical protein
MEVLDSEEHIEGEALGSKLGFLKIDVLNLSMPLPKSELVRVFTTVRTANNKSYTIYTLSNSGASYRVAESYFAKSLGIVP